MFGRIRPLTLLVAGGLLSSVVLGAFGTASMVVGYQGREDVRDTLRQENIVAPKDSTIPGQLVDTGSEARAQADVIRKHQLTSSAGLTYAEMGRFRVVDANPAGTNDAALAVKDANGKPLSNPVRESWVTATALSTSLNTAYFAEQVALFSIVMGAALLLTGVGFGVLTLGTLVRHKITVAEERAVSAAPAMRPHTVA